MADEGSAAAAVQPPGGPGPVAPLRPPAFPPRSRPGVHDPRGHAVGRSWIDILAFAVVLLLAAIVPETSESPTAAPAPRAPATGLRRWRPSFLDALPDPASVLDRRSVVFSTSTPRRAGNSRPSSSIPAAFTLRPSCSAPLRRFAGQRPGHRAPPVGANETWHRVTVAARPRRCGQRRRAGRTCTTSPKASGSSPALRFHRQCQPEAAHPLTSLVGFIDTLLAPPPTTRRRASALGLMRGQAGRMASSSRTCSRSRIEMRQHSPHRPGRAQHPRARGSEGRSRPWIPARGWR